MRDPHDALIPPHEFRFLMKFMRVHEGGMRFPHATLMPTSCTSFPQEFPEGPQEYLKNLTA